MPNFRREIGFLVAILAFSLILFVFPYDETSVALYRMEEQILREPAIYKIVDYQCTRLEAPKNDRLGLFFAKLHKPATSEELGTSNCFVDVVATHSENSPIKKLWQFAVLFRSETGNVILQKNFRVDFLTPLCLLPLVVFLLALLFTFKAWNLAWTAGTYLLLLGGGNLIQTLNLILDVTMLTFTGDQTFLSLLLFIIWLSLRQSRREIRFSPHQNVPVAYGVTNRLFALVFGLWNPAAYTLAGKIFLPFKGSPKKIVVFLDSQLLICCLSLYLLFFNWKYFEPFLKESFFLPRYFSFAVLLFLSVNYGPSKSWKHSSIWRLPRFWPSMGAIAAIELGARLVPFIGELPTFTRIGIALVFSELLWIKSISPKFAFKVFFPTTKMLFLASFIALASIKSGIIELVLVALEPRIHPTAVAFFTFMAGAGLGFLTGSFSIVFFTLYALFLPSPNLPLVKAALIDGILAGNLLSPFSVLNLFPAALFRIPIQELVRFRFRQMAAPLLIALFIYAVCAINSVAILQPVTFIFLCLVVLAIQLSKRSWQLGQGKPLQDSHSG